MRFLRILTIAGLWLAAVRAEAAEPSIGRDVTQLYAEFCSGCHGPKLEGGKGGSLVDDRWKHGGDDESIARSIRDGRPWSGMPAFRGALEEAEVKAMVTFIRETAVRRKEPEPKEEDPLPRGVQRSQEHAFRFEVVAEGLDVPWSFAFLPDGRILATERVGRLRVIEQGRLRPEAIEGLPEVFVRDEAGLMSVVADPHYAENGWVYLSFSDIGPGETSMTRIVRGRLRAGRFVDQEDVFAVARECYQRSSVLFGGRLVFHGEHLFFSVGERGMEEGTTGQAQDLTTANGKIHRVRRDGSVPPDNPFVGEPGYVGSIWALGVRNPHGLAIDRRNGDLWETEHGPRGGDELNRIERGKNYGWPVVTRGMNYNGTPISEKKEVPGMEPPVIDWTPSIAVDQIEFYTGEKFPNWRDHLFIGSLAQQKFLRAVVEDGRIVHTEEVFAGYGRVRDIKTGPDGFLYLALERIGKPGRIVRMVPAE